MGDKAEPKITECRFLGMAHDSMTRYEFPHRAHRCWATNHPQEVDLQFQSAICVRPEFRDCVRHRQREKPPEPAEEQTRINGLLVVDLPPELADALRTRIAAGTKRV